VGLGVAGKFQVEWCTVAALLLFALPLHGQVQYGDLKMNLNGIVNGGYNGSYGDLIGSAHSFAVGGSGNLSGSFYDPNFLSFSFAPYYDRSQANSNYASISDASGFNLTSGIFSGSHFPGSINFAKAYNSQGLFAVPGLGAYSTFGNSSTFGLHWSELVPDLPSLSFAYQQGSSDYSVYGTHDTGNSHHHSFNLQSGYRIEGFNLAAYYTQGASDSLVPDVLGSTVQSQKENADYSGYGFNVSHAIPLRGQVLANFNSSTVNSDFLGYKFNGTINTINTSAGIQPTNKLHLSFNADYSDNLNGQLYLATVPNSSTVSSSNQESHAIGLQGNGSYNLLDNLQTQVYVDRRTQHYLGEDFGATNYGAGASYGRGLLGGSFSTSFFLIANTLDGSDEHTLGLNTSTSFSKRIGLWAFGGSFNYAQNVQTLLISYTTSYYNYSFNVRKKFQNRMVMSASAGFSQSGLTAEPATENHSKSFSAGMGYGQWIAVSGTYSKASGQGLLGGNGVNGVPLPPVIPDSLLIFYGGRSYSAAISSTPIRRFTMSAALSKTNSSTFGSGVGSLNNVEQFNAYFQYQFRKMNLTGGYSRLMQGFTAAGTPPSQVSSFSIGVSRWFNFF
jgi:hypothetical protein